MPCLLNAVMLTEDTVKRIWVWFTFICLKYSYLAITALVPEILLILNHFRVRTTGLRRMSVSAHHGKPTPRTC